VFRPNLGPVALAVCAWIAAAPPSFAQTQVLDASEPVAITSTTPVVIDSVAVETAGLRDVALVAHLYAEGSDFNGGGYEFRLERTSPSFGVVGTIDWAPAEALSASPIGDTISLVGFDLDQDAPATYRLVGQKIDAGAANLTVTARGIDAIHRNAGTLVSGARASGSIGIPASTTTELGATVQVDLIFTSDVLLVGHVTLTKAPGTGGTYGIGICDAEGEFVGVAQWQHALEAAETNAIAVVAYVANLTADTTFSLCAYRSGEAPVATATFRSLVAVRATNTISGSAALPGAAPPLLSTSLTSIWVLEVANVDPDGMAIVVQTNTLGENIDHALYDFGIHRGSCAGERLGATGVRQSADEVDAALVDPILLTAWDPSPEGVESYAFCGRKTSPAAADLGFYALEMAALPLPAPEPAGAAATLAGVAAVLALARARRTRAR
jgi:hypothetical protein